MKGKILNIQIVDNEIVFDLEVDTLISQQFSLHHRVLKYNNGKTQIQIRVKDGDQVDESIEVLPQDTIVPFQVAYAVSIHKAQGLEYDSVKIVINKDSENYITHNIFYTAITRSKRHLKIFWSPEVSDYILKSIEPLKKNSDSKILKQNINIS